MAGLTATFDSACKSPKIRDLAGFSWTRTMDLADEKAVLSAMAYVDLKLIRAGMANTPETSDDTSIKLRIKYWKSKATDKSAAAEPEHQPESLLAFAGNLRQPMPRGLAFKWVVSNFKHRFCITLSIQ